MTGTLDESAVWADGVRYFEENAVLTGGPDCPDNLPLLDLANRTAWLKVALEQVASGAQPADATLTALAALVMAADTLIYATGPDQFATTGLSAFIRTLLPAADAATARGTLGLGSVATLPIDIDGTMAANSDARVASQKAIRTYVQAAVAALVNSSPVTLDTLKELADALGDDPNFAVTMATALGNKQPLSTLLTNLAGVVTAADKLIYSTGANTFATVSLSAFIRTLLPAADQATALGTLGAAGTGLANVFSKGQAGTWATLPATTGTVSPDFTASNLFTSQSTGNITFGNGYTGPGAGKGCAFIIRLQQGAASLYNWSFGSNWKYVGGSSAIPSQTQSLGAWDTIVGEVLTDGTVEFAVRSNVA